MADIPTLFASEPLDVPAKVFDKLWVREIVLSSPTGGEAEARVTLVRFRTTDDGVEEAPAEPVRLHVRDLLAGAEADADLAAAVGALMNYVAKVGVAEGVVAAGE
jgi:hypothetical protein